ncbi:MAG: hypothetical protein OEV49_09550 [candidate division Zixibacteria bacterium]|nr:hypothetical protein [candidate division Zixibacteria bacterium]MDH3938163.1 hypothetical protein [candidate division Zixibacteria bacterium]MDH4033538.1 hypothetical protein [candidate division Zixibacteria bacterium]
MFCPNCRYEYLETVTVCPDCNERLVSQLRDKSKESDSYDDWVRLALLSSMQHSKVVVEALHSNDIPAVLLSDNGPCTHNCQMGSVSEELTSDGFMVLVPSEFVGEADQIAGSVLGEEWEQAKLYDVEP